MRKITKVLCITLALSVQFMAGQALAALTAAGPALSTAPGAAFPADNRPAFYQDANGLSLQNCLDNTPLGALTPMCVLSLLNEQDYNPALSIVYNGGLTVSTVAPTIGQVVNGPTGVQDNPGKNGGIVNYPGASFYYHVSPNPKATIPIGTGTIRLILAEIEAASVSKTLVQTLPVGGPAIGVPRPVDGQQATFQRYLVDINNAQPGAYTLTHPWGTATFNCLPGVVLCKFVDDTPLGTAMNFNAVPDPALGGAKANTIGPFMVAAGPGIPAAPLPFTTNAAGNTFIGLGTGLTSKGIVPGVCPNCPKDANGFSFFRVDGPLGITTGNITDFQISGQIIGLQVLPSNSINLGPATIGAPAAVPPVVKTVTIKNLTGNPVNIPALVTSGADFAIVAATAPAVSCNGLANLAINASCTIDVTFTPVAGATAARSATIAVAATTVPVAAPGVTPPNPGPLTIILSGTAQYPLTVAVATTLTAPVNVGTGTLTSTPAGLNCSTAVGATCTASFDVGSTVTLTPTPTTSPLALFDGWALAGASCSGTGNCAVLVDAAKGTPAAPAAIADFIESHKITTSAVPAAGGTITSTQTVKHAATPTIVITPTVTTSPRVSYRFGSLTDTAGLATAVPVAGTNSFTYLLAPVDADHTIVANFVQQFILTPTLTGVGGVIAPATPQTLDSGVTQNFTVTPDPGYRIGTVLVDGAPQVVTTASFAAPFAALSGDHSINASFIKVWKVDSSVVGSGNVDKLGTNGFDDGATPSYTFTPSSKQFQVGKILLDGAPQTFTKPATISGAVTFALPVVKADKTLSATFVPSGDLDANGSVDVADALKALKIFVKLQTPVGDDLAAMRIGGLDSSGVPNAGTGSPDLNDIILILKKAIKAVTW